MTERKPMFEFDFNEEQEDWARLTPVERYLESCKLWEIYLSMGGSLDPQPDSQSPFDFPELERAISLDGRAGVYFVRRGGYWEQSNPDFVDVVDLMDIVDD